MKLKRSLILAALVFVCRGPANAQDWKRSSVERDDVTAKTTRTKFSLHRLNYAALGVDDMKLQLSFKYRILQGRSFYAGYSQVMFWDVYAESLPFRDINYKPELFYRGDGPGPVNRWDAGYRHTSNGTAGPQSRSIDTPFLRGIISIEVEGRELLFMPEALIPLARSDNNPDIYDYRGYWSLTLAARRLLDPNRENLDVIVEVFPGKAVDFSQGAVSVALKIALRFPSVNPDVYVQYYRGFAESLLDYDKQTDKVRAGVALYF